MTCDSGYPRLELDPSHVLYIDLNNWHFRLRKYCCVRKNKCSSDANCGYSFLVLYLDHRKVQIANAVVLPRCHLVDSLITSHKHHRLDARECRFIVSDLTWHLDRRLDSDSSVQLLSTQECDLHTRLSFTVLHTAHVFVELCVVRVERPEYFPRSGGQNGMQ